MKHQAPPILSSLDFAGRENQWILVELEDLRDLLNAFSCDDVVYILAPNKDELHQALRCQSWLVSGCDSIAHAVRRIQQFPKKKELQASFIIHRIDLMDSLIDKRSRGSLRKGFLSMLSKRIMEGCNVFVTSGSEEYLLREMSDQFINLKTL